MASWTSDGSNPDFPIQVMQPKPAIVNPSLYKSSYKPAFVK